jgi:Tfp pilus assembly protein PilF
LDEQLKRREAEKKRKEDEAARKKKEQFDALPENKQHASTAKDAGNEAYKNGDFKKALELYTKASEHDPTDAVFLNNMAAAHIGLKVRLGVVDFCF